MLSCFGGLDRPDGEPVQLVAISPTVSREPVSPTVSPSSFAGLDGEPVSPAPALDGSKVGPVQLVAFGPTVSREPVSRSSFEGLDGEP